MTSEICLPSAEIIIVFPQGLLLYTGTHYVTPPSLELSRSLALASQCWDCKYALLCSAPGSWFFNILPSSDIQFYGVCEDIM